MKDNIIVLRAHISQLMSAICAVIILSFIAGLLSGFLMFRSKENSVQQFMEKSQNRLPVIKQIKKDEKPTQAKNLITPTKKDNGTLSDDAPISSVKVLTPEDKPEPQPEPKIEGMPETVSKKTNTKRMLKRYTVQIGAFKNYENALKYQNIFIQKGYAPYIFEADSSSAITWYCVRIADFYSRQDAINTKKQFETDENAQASVLHYNSLQAIDLNYSLKDDS